MRKPQMIFTFWLVFLLCGALPLYAGDPGSAGAQFLKTGQGARPMGMGGAFAGLADDVNAIYWNPGGMGFVERPELLLMHNANYADITNQYLGFVYPFQGLGTFGTAITYQDYGDIDRTLITSATTYADIGSYNATDFALALSYGRQLSPQLGIGGNVKWINSKIETENARAFAVDLGLLYRVEGLPLTAGLALQHMGTRLKYIEESDKLPFNFKAGLAYEVFPDIFTIAFDINKPIDNDMLFNLGAEYWLGQMFALRLGYDSMNDAGTGLTAGAGFRYQDLELDYAWVDGGDLDDAHRVSLNFQFGATRSAGDGDGDVETPAPREHARAPEPEPTAAAADEIPIPAPRATPPAPASAGATDRVAAPVPVVDPTGNEVAELMQAAYYQEAQGDLRGAMLTDRLIVEIDQSNYQAYFKLGRLAYQLNEWDFAKDAFTAALQLRPEAVGAMVNLGAAQYGLGDYANAATLWDKALRYDPSNGFARTNLDLLYRDHPELRREVQQTAVANQQHDQIVSLLKRAQEEMARRDYLSAAQSCHQALQLDRNSFEAYYIYGQAVYRLGNYDYAQSAFSSALQLQPESESALTNLGATYFQRGEYAQARDMWEQVLAINPNNVFATNNLEALYQQYPDLHQ